MKTAHRCCGIVSRGMWDIVQCSKMAKFERNGKWYCGTHDPVAIELKAAAKLQKWNAEREAKRKDREEKAAAQLEIERKAAMYDELLEALIHLRHNAYASGADMGLAIDVADMAIAKSTRDKQ